MIRNFIRRVKYFLINLTLYYVGNRKIPDREKSVFFDLNDNLFYNYLHTVGLFFARQNYTIYFKPNLLFIAHAGSWRLFESNIYTKIRFSPPANSILITDRLENKIHKEKWIELGHDYFTSNDTNDFKFPMFMYHVMYSDNYTGSDYSQIEQTRPVTVFFCGNFDDREGAYNNNILRTKFACYNRVQLLKFLKGEFQNKIVFPSSLEEFDSHLNRGCFFMINNVYNGFRITQEHFISSLKKASFIIGFPGVVMPLCHNLVEAMYCGVIPIIQKNYAVLFPIPLTNGINCFTFSTLSELSTLIVSLNNLNISEIASMRKNVLDYYNNYLHPDVVMKGLFKYIDNGGKRIVLNAEGFSVSLLKPGFYTD